MLKVNLRGKNINALVLESRNAAEVKSEIRSADFQLKKISGAAIKPFLQKEFLEAVKDTAQYFVASSGAFLSHLIPAFILENINLLAKTDYSGQIVKNPERLKNEMLALQAPDEERAALYRSLIREEFAKKRSVFMCLPQNESIKNARENLERGIESFVCVFHSDMSKKDLAREIKKVYQTKHPVLIIGTAKWLFLPKNDLGTIIIDKENETGWKTLSRPFIDFRVFIETLASKKNVRLIMGDSFLRIETLYRYKQGEIGEFESVKWRLLSNTATQVVDLRETSKKEFKVLSGEFLELINDTISKKSSIFIFAARKGLSSVTICRDCGEQVKCLNCASPMVLYKTKIGGGGVFKCHQCGETRDAAETCRHCQSWKLASFGSGIDRVAEEIRKNIPGVKLFEIHKDVASTHSRALGIIKNFYEERGSILLGTEMALNYLPKKVGRSAISSFDSLFSIPDFRIREKIFRLVLETKNLAREKFLIQTRNPDDPTIKFALNGNLMEFYKGEIEDRRILEYPPFSIFIKITVRGTRNLVNKETEILKNIFSEIGDKSYGVAIFPSIHEKKGEQSAVNTVIKLLCSDWPNHNLISLLKSLPPHFEIKVDPDNLL